MMENEEKKDIIAGAGSQIYSVIENSWKKWKVPMLALALALVMLVQLLIIGTRQRDSWAIFRDVTTVRMVLLWAMTGGALLIPLSGVKQVDKIYNKIREFPIEISGGITFIAWMMVHSNIQPMVNHMRGGFGRALRLQYLFSDQNVRTFYFLGLFFLGLVLLGYLVQYGKELYVAGREGLKKDSLLYKLYIEFIAVDLKKGQNVRIFALALIQYFIIFGLFIWGDDRGQHEVWLLLFLPVYLLTIFFYSRYKIAKARKNYLQLIDIVQSIADGDLDVEVPENLGYFDSLKDELTTIQNGLGHAVERALTSERMKGDLITNVSHDLKTPLTSIITYVDLLQVEGLSDEKRASYLKTLELKTERLRMLIEDLFEVSKASSGNLELDMSEVDVVTLMKQTILGLEDRIGEAGLVLREGYPEGGIKLELDGGRMHRVFENLIVNMVKYAMPGTRAYIDIMILDEQVAIILRNISNHEITMDMNDLSERFVRGETARSTEGSGLGLAIAKSFVELQGGTFDIVVDGDLFKVIITF